MGRHFSKRLKLLASLSVLVVMFASLSVAYAGARWTGIDPELQVEGHKVNIVIAVPPAAWCNIDGPIRINAAVPDLDNAKLIFESEGMMGQGKKQCYVSTVTTLTEHDRGDNFIGVQGFVNSDHGRRNFPVDIVVSVNDVEQTVCAGFANQRISCGAISLVDEVDEKVRDIKEKVKEKVKDKKGRFSR